MKLKKKKFHRFIIYILPFLIGTLVACQTTLYNLSGVEAKPESRIVLHKGGLHEGALQTRDLSLKYSYVRNPDNLLLTGVVELDDRLKYNYELVDYFILTVNFLDGDGKVLDRESIIYYVSVEMIEKLSFKRNLKIPPGTAAMAFNYKGRVMESGERHSGWDFYLNPLRRVSS